MEHVSALGLWQLTGPAPISTGPASFTPHSDGESSSRAVEMECVSALGVLSLTGPTPSALTLPSSALDSPHSDGDVGL